MKIQYTKKYTDQHGHTFQPGWIAEHTNPECQRRINAGVAIQVSNEARTFKLAPVQAPVVLCVPDEPLLQQEEQPEKEKFTSNKQTQKK